MIIADHYNLKNNTQMHSNIFRLVLSGVGGSTGGMRCCWGAPSLPQVPPATLKSPPPYTSLLFLCFCRDGSNQHKIWAAGGKSVFIWEAGWEEPFGNNSTFSCFRNQPRSGMGMLMGLCLVFCVFFCKPVDVVEGSSLRACCSDGGVSDVGVGSG